MLERALPDLAAPRPTPKMTSQIARDRRGRFAGFGGFRSNLEGTPLGQLGGLGADHMAGAGKDQTNGPLLDGFFVIAVCYRESVLWFLKLREVLAL